MDVLSLSPLRTGSVVWQPRRGSWVMTAVCKATYTLLPTECALAPEQEYPNEDDNHWNDDAARSLYSPGDLVPFKPRADVMLVGHAFAPRNEPVRSLVARLLVGEADKAIEVFGDRSFAPDGSLRDGPRFTRVPLRWERAAGGPESRNPVGMRLDTRPDAFGMVPLPNLQKPALMVASPRDTIEPIGFGPIAWSWPERRERLGRYAATWSPETWARQPLPEDLDPAFFNAAPRDQRIDALRSNERIVLENLHPEHERLVTNLPGLTPRAFVERRGAAPQEVQLVADTLWIDTDRSICTVTWRAQIPLDHPAQPGRVLVALAEPGQRLTWADVERLAAGPEPESSDRKTPVPAMDGAYAPVPTAETSVPPRSMAALPFVPASPEIAAKAATPEPPASKPRRASSDPLARTHDEVIPALAAALPFGGAGAPGRPAQPPSGDAAPPWLTQSRLVVTPPPATTPPPLPAAAVPAAPLSAVPLSASALPPVPSSASVPAAPLSASALPPAPLPAPVPAAPTFGPPLPVPPPRPAPTFGPPPSAPPPAHAALHAPPPAQSALHVPPLPAPPVVPPPRESGGRPREIVDLLWFDAASIPRIRAAWKTTIDAQRPRASTDDDDRRAAAAVLARGEPLAPDELQDAIAEAVEPDGSFTPPLVLLGGELVFTLGEALIDAASERALLDQRRYQERLVFGGRCITALLFAAGDDSLGVPAYLPDAMAARLPLYRRFAARIIAEAHLAQDEREASPVALRVVAIARTVPLDTHGAPASRRHS
ncbi:MAG: DUF2169 domain-containing protein [Minicystis sp.]